MRREIVKDGSTLSGSENNAHFGRMSSCFRLGRASLSLTTATAYFEVYCASMGGEVEAASSIYPLVSM